MSVLNPCCDCDRRVLGCHSTCKDYRDYKDGLAARGNKIRTQRESYNFLISSSASRKQRQIELKKQDRARKRR